MNFDIIYSTAEDAEYFADKVPKLRQFGFNSTNLEDHYKPFKTIAKIENLKAWDNVVLNTKIWHLKKSYLNCLVFHKRGLCTNVKYMDTNTLTFVYYLENAFYTIQSIDDIFLQILNVFYDINVKDNDVAIRVNKDRSPNGSYSTALNNANPKAFKIFVSHINAVKIEKDVRNSSIHRYPLLFLNRKTSVELIEGKESIRLSSFKNDLPDHEDLLNKLERWIRQTEQLQNHLVDIFGIPRIQ